MLVLDLKTIYQTAQKDLLPWGLGILHFPSRLLLS